MSTAHRNDDGGHAAPPILTLTRAQRDALREQVLLDLDGDDLTHYVRKHRPAEAREELQRLGSRLDVLDQLGWTEYDERTTFALTVDPAISALLLDMEGHATAALQEEGRARVAAAEGELALRRESHWIDVDLDVIQIAKLARSAGRKGGA